MSAEDDEKLDKNQAETENEEINSEGDHVKYLSGRRISATMGTILQNVGQFFGITESENLQEWKDQNEMRLKRGDFGFTLKPEERLKENEFTYDVKCVLSQIDEAEEKEDNFKIVRSKSLSIPRRVSFDQDLEFRRGKTLLLRRSTMPAFKTHRKLSDRKPLRRKLSSIDEVTKEEDEEFYDAESGIEVEERDVDKIDTIDEVKESAEGKPLSFISVYNPTFEETEEEYISETLSSGARLDHPADSIFVDPQTHTELKKLNKKLHENEKDGDTLSPTPVTSTFCDFKSDITTGKYNEILFQDFADPAETERSKGITTMEADKLVGGVTRKRSLEWLKDSSKVLDDTEQEQTSSLNRREDMNPSFGLVFGADGLTQYQLYLQFDKEAKKRELEATLSEQMEKYDWKIQALNELVDLARDYYLNPCKKSVSKWKQLRSRVRRKSCTEMRRKMDRLPEYKPIFTIFIILAQLVSFTVIFALGGLTYIGVTPQLSMDIGIQTFMGLETVHRWIPPNLWIGPSQKHIVSVGGVFAPCMRRDIEIQLMYTQANYSHLGPLGCCEVKNRNTAGTTTQAECEHLTAGLGFWRGNTTCANRPVELTSVKHVLKPCCVGLKGQCQLISHAHCTFLDGYFHRSGPEHCSQVFCLGHICSQGTLTPSADQSWMPESPSQWWRLPLSLLYHQGLIQLLLVTAIQCILLWKIERTAGWLRMLIIYVVSGAAALITSAVFTPYQSHVGGVGAVFGMVGVTLVELIQFWKIVTSPGKELAKIVAAVSVFLFLGTLPYMDIFGMISGLIFGALTGIVLLPYINFGAWQARMRIVLIAIALPILFMCTFAVMQLFVSVQTVDSCRGCRLINCVPYTKTMCDTEMWQL